MQSAQNQRKQKANIDGLRKREEEVEGRWHNTWDRQTKMYSLGPGRVRKQAQFTANLLQAMCICVLHFINPLLVACVARAWGTDDAQSAVKLPSTADCNSLTFHPLNSALSSPTTLNIRRFLFFVGLFSTYSVFGCLFSCCAYLFVYLFLWWVFLQIHLLLSLMEPRSFVRVYFQKLLPLRVFFVNTFYLFAVVAIAFIYNRNQIWDNNEQM